MIFAASPPTFKSPESLHHKTLKFVQSQIATRNCIFLLALTAIRLVKHVGWIDKNLGQSKTAAKTTACIEKRPRQSIQFLFLVQLMKG
jgi:hypothetical protein